MLAIVVIVLAVWLLCGVFAFGLGFAHLQGEYDLGPAWYWGDWLASAPMTFTGPLGIVFILKQYGGKHGLKWW